MNGRGHDEYGGRCSCRLLAALVECKHKTIGSTCRHAVLMKHWVIECNHGCQDEVVESMRGDKWHDVGPISPTVAILIRNA